MTTSSKQMQKIIDQIIKTTELDNLPKAEEASFRKNMEAQINQRIGLAIISGLDRAGLDEYERITKKGIPRADVFQKFLEKYLPDYKNKIRTGIDSFVDESIAALI